MNYVSKEELEKIYYDMQYEAFKTANNPIVDINTQWRLRLKIQALIDNYENHKPSRQELENIYIDFTKYGR